MPVQDGAEEPDRGAAIFSKKTSVWQAWQDVRYPVTSLN